MKSQKLFYLFFLLEMWMDGEKYSKDIKEIIRKNPDNYLTSMKLIYLKQKINPNS